MNKFEAEWTGDYPSLCHGRWVLTYCNEPIQLPDDVVREPMNTKNVYKRWSFNDVYQVVFDEYEDGLGFVDWVEENKEWVIKMFMDNHIDIIYENFKELYLAFKENDWRHGSCGGCI